MTQDLAPVVPTEPDDFSPEALIYWLEAKYSRHGELEDKMAAELIRKLAAHPQQGWQPIETAPIDGTEFLGYRDGKFANACRVLRDDCEMWVFGGQSADADVSPQIKPTHWMPLPEPPGIGERSKG